MSTRPQTLGPVSAPPGGHGLKARATIWLPWLVVAGLALACVPAVRQYPSIFFEYQLDYFEGFVYRTALLIAQGHPIYQPWQQPIGGMGAPYPPVYFVVYALLIRLFSPSLALGRLLSLAASLGLAALAWKIVKRATNSALCATAAALFFISFHNDFTMLARVDALAAFLTCAGVFVVYRQIADEGRLNARAVDLATLLFVLSALTKQNAVAGFLATAAFLLIRRQYRLAARAAFLYCGLLALITAVLAWSTHGNYLFLLFRFHLFTSFIWGELVFGAFYYFLPASLLLLIAALALRRAKSTLNGSNDLKVFFTCYALAACLIATSYGKEGAGFNYFIELSAIVAVAFGIGLHHLDSAFARPRARRAIFAGVIAGLVVLNQYNWALARTNLADQRTVYKGLERLLDRVAGPVLCEDTSVLVRRGRSDETLDWFAYRTLWTAGKLDQRGFLRDLRNGAFRALVFKRVGLPLGPVDFFSPDRVTPQQLEVIRTHFRSVQPFELGLPERLALAGFVVLVPCADNCAGSAVLPAAGRPELRAMLAQVWWNRIRLRASGSARRPA
jgi:hypothetical protein